MVPRCCRARLRRPVVYELEAAAELVLGTSAAGPGPRPVMRRGLCLARRRHQGIVSCPRCRTASRRPRATLRPSPPTPMPLHLLRFAPAAPDRQNSATQRRPANSGDRQTAATGKTADTNVDEIEQTFHQTHAGLQRVEESTGGFRARLLSSAAVAVTGPCKNARHVATHRCLEPRHSRAIAAWPRRCRHRAATSAIALTPTPASSRPAAHASQSLSPTARSRRPSPVFYTASSAATCRAGPQPAPCSSRRARLRALFS